jgi:hypothetical protein
MSDDLETIADELVLCRADPVRFVDTMSPGLPIPSSLAKPRSRGNATCCARSGMVCRWGKP